MRVVIFVHSFYYFFKQNFKKYYQYTKTLALMAM